MTHIHLSLVLEKIIIHGAIQLVSFHKLGFLFKLKPPARGAYAPVGHAEKITTLTENLPGQASICLIFRGLFFEHNTNIGQKDHLWIDTNY
jgi:hypothetical protein